eukprot:1695826-Amphidinium_carterae.1
MDLLKQARTSALVPRDPPATNGAYRSYLPEAQKVDQLLAGTHSLEFSYSPHNREELLRIYGMLTEATAFEWLVPGTPDTPNKGSQQAGADPAADAPMVPEVEDPYFDEEEEEISRLKKTLFEKETALAAKRRKVEGTRGL